MLQRPFPSKEFWYSGIACHALPEDFFKSKLLGSAGNPERCPPGGWPDGCEVWGELMEDGEENGVKMWQRWGEGG